jgi:hypothetical protein
MSGGLSDGASPLVFAVKVFLNGQGILMITILTQISGLNYASK